MKEKKLTHNIAEETAERYRKFDEETYLEYERMGFPLKEIQREIHQVVTECEAARQEDPVGYRSKINDIVRRYLPSDPIPCPKDDTPEEQLKHALDCDKPRSEKKKEL